MIKIENPQFKIIETLPSTLGTVDYYLCLYDKIDTREDIFDKIDASEIAEELYETGMYSGIYVIHSSTTRGEDINPLSKDNHFCCNRINCDSILIYHCLAMKNNEGQLILRTGFHESHPSFNISKMVYDWDSLINVSNGFLELEINNHVFFKLYQEEIKKWRQEVSKVIH